MLNCEEYFCPWYHNLNILTQTSLQFSLRCPFWPAWSYVVQRMTTPLLCLLWGQCRTSRSCRYINQHNLGLECFFVYHCPMEMFLYTQWYKLSSFTAGVTCMVVTGMSVIAIGVQFTFQIWAISIFKCYFRFVSSSALIEWARLPQHCGKRGFYADFYLK